MVVWVKVRITPLKGSKREPFETAGIANAAFGSKFPEVVIPLNLAEKLGLWPSLPEGTKIDTYLGPAGIEVKAYRIEDAAEVRVVTKDRISDPARVLLALMEEQSEVILSDRTLDALGIELLMPGAGIWRFRGEERSRKSEKPKYW